VAKTKHKRNAKKKKLKKFKKSREKKLVQKVNTGINIIDNTENKDGRIVVCSIDEMASVSNRESLFDDVFLIGPPPDHLCIVAENFSKFIGYNKKEKDKLLSSMWVGWLKREGKFPKIISGGTVHMYLNLENDWGEFFESRLKGSKE
jgi:hypothetical protein